SNSRTIPVLQLLTHLSQYSCCYCDCRNPIERCTYVAFLVRNSERFIGTDWYKVTALDLKELGGNSLLELYDNSLLKLLEHMYPDFRWYPWLFDKVPVGYWDVPRNVINYVIWLCEQLCIENPHQISSISRTQMMN